MKQHGTSIVRQLISLTLGAILLSQLFILWLVYLRADFGSEEKWSFSDTKHIINVYQTLKTLNTEQRPTGLKLANNGELHYSISANRLAKAPPSEHQIADSFKSDFGVSGAYVTEQSITLNDILKFWMFDDMEGCFDFETLKEMPEHCPYLHISLPLTGEEWLNVKTIPAPNEMVILFPIILSALITSTGILFAVFIAVKRITSPLQTLSLAAEKLGRGEVVEQLNVHAPREVASTISAFNTMQERLTRFVQDRTKMLAAISHDLRTPITSLRLRAEFIEDKSLQDKMITTLDELKNMVAECLLFSSQESQEESRSQIDLIVVLGALSDDFPTISFVPQLKSCLLSGRITSLKRALRNVIENAAHYGQSGHIAVVQGDQTILITIVDNGPGVPEDCLENIFEPFVRLEKERNTESGSVGLGLSIARTIIHHHGGTMCAANTDSGFKIAITLPTTAGKVS